MLTEELSQRVFHDAVVGSLIGLAVGDALGLPYEGLSKNRQRKLVKNADSYQFLFGRGMVSDDTDHACMVAQSVIVSGCDPDVFINSLSWRLRFWILGLPAGIGMATLRGAIRLWFGRTWRTSGVWSGGNGPSMRGPLLGVLFARDPERCRAFVHRSTILTHTDPKAEIAAMAIAVAARLAYLEGGEVTATRYIAIVREEIGSNDEGFFEILEGLGVSLESSESTEVYAEKLGLGTGVTGYSFHTVPVVLHAWLSCPTDYSMAIKTVIRCGGDTDTSAAILGGIIGATVGERGIPALWRARIVEWPCTLAWVKRLGIECADSATSKKERSAIHFNVLGQLLRNLLFLLVVLCHGFRRLLPPY